MLHSDQRAERVRGEISESEAIRLARQGNSSAFEHLYKMHSPLVYALCLRMSGNPTEAEDLTQDAFLQLFRKIQTFRGEARFSTWLYRLTVNVVLMRRRKKRYPEISLDATAETDDALPMLDELGAPDLQLSGMLDQVNLSRALDQLPQGYRQMFLLHDVHGYEHQEIAKLLGCSIGNSKSQLFKARLRLREALREPERSRAREQREAMRNSPPPQQRDEKFRCCGA